MRLHLARSCTATSVLLLVLAAGCGPPTPSGVPVPAGVPAPGPPTVEAGLLPLEVVGDRPAVLALRILRGWDRRRAAAYAAGEPQRLRRLYAPGCRAGAKDVRILRSYAERGLVVDGLTTQVLEVRLLAAAPDLRRLRIVERVVGGRVATTSGRGRTALPSGTPSPRVVTLVDTGGGWVVRAVRRG